METVKVLMSTYNGAAFVQRQIDSVLAQKGVGVELLVRDDGSKDGTQALLTAYQDKGLLRWYQGENLRPCQSFLELLDTCGDSAYYAFCDQDDYWHPDKLAAGVAMLQEISAGGPKLYFGKKNIVDKDLKPLGRPDTDVRVVSYGAALLNCVASGCTMVMNREAVALLRTYHPRHATMHDAWVYRLVNAFGTVVYDPVPHMDYRQHGGNEVGADKDFATRLRLGVRTIGQRRHMTYRSTGAREMLEAFGSQLSPRDRKLTEQLSAVPTSRRARWQLVRNRDLRAQTGKELFFIKIFILLGWI